jgi:hypothetical protein
LSRLEPDRSEAAGRARPSRRHVDTGPLFAALSAAIPRPGVRRPGDRARQVETEANCANDNPLIDPDSGEIFHTGNFLAQYTGVAMDQLRYHLGLLAKHVDVQIALLMTPEFSYGL